MSNRRQFMASLVSLPLAGTLDRTRFPQGALQSTPYSAANVRRFLLPLFEHPEQAQVVGSQFLKIYENEAPLRLLMLRIFQDGVPHNEGTFRAYLDRRKRLDFEQADVVSIDGWLLSVTEARLCAALALTRKDPL